MPKILRLPTDFSYAPKTLYNLERSVGILAKKDDSRVQVKKKDSLLFAIKSKNFAVLFIPPKVEQFLKTNSV